MKKEKSKKSACLVAILIMFIIHIAITPMSVFCYDNKDSLVEELNDSVISELDNIDISGLNDLIDDFSDEEINLFSLGDIKTKIYSILSGEEIVDFNNVFCYLFSNLSKLILKYLPVLSVIVAIGIMSNLLSGLKSNFNEKSTNGIVSIVCFLSVTAIVIGVVGNLTTRTGLSITKMVKEMNLIFPILLTLMIGVGANASIGVYQPILAIMTTVVTDIFEYFITPLFILSFVFNIISNLSTNVKMNKFSSFINSIFKWTVGLVFTLFFAIISIQGISAGKFDSIGIRTTKYTIKSYVPIMGGYLSDGMDLILASSLIIKNSVGFVGLLLIITTMLSPIVEIIVVNLILKLASAIVEPLGSNSISNFLSGTSSSILILSTSLIAIGFMYILQIGLIILTAGVV